MKTNAELADALIEMHERQLTREDVFAERIIELRKSGLTHGEIAKLIPLFHQTDICSIIKKVAPELRKLKDISGRNEEIYKLKRSGMTIKSLSKQFGLSSGRVATIISDQRRY